MVEERETFPVWYACTARDEKLMSFIVKVFTLQSSQKRKRNETNILA